MDTKSTHTRNGRLKKSQKNANGEGSIYWSDSRKRWVAQFTFSASNRPSKFYKLKKDATKWLEEQKRMKAMGQSSYTPHAKMNLKDFLEAWLEHRHTRNMAPETYRNYKGAISRISMEIGEQNASKLSPHAIEHGYEILHGLALSYNDLSLFPNEKAARLNSQRVIVNNQSCFSPEQVIEAQNFVEKNK